MTMHIVGELREGIEVTVNGEFIDKMSFPVFVGGVSRKGMALKSGFAALGTGQIVDHAPMVNITIDSVPYCAKKISGGYFESRWMLFEGHGLVQKAAA